MDIKTKVIFDHGDQYGGISVKKESYIEFNGQEIPISEPERRAFNPTQIKELKIFAPSLETVCSAMWTPEVIERWEAYQKNITLMEA